MTIESSPVLSNYCNRCHAGRISGGAAIQMGFYYTEMMMCDSITSEKYQEVQV